MEGKLYDTTIIGGGPAGVAAAVYAARKKLKTLLVAENFGGQSIVSTGIENWIGEEKITGLELSEKLERHVRAQGGIEIRVSEKVTGVTEEPNCIFEVRTNEGGHYRSKTVIIASGARSRRLDVPGEDKFDGKGVAFCSTCDAPFFKDFDVAVVGSGNSALEGVIDLFPYAKQIYLLIRSEKVKGDVVTQEQVTQSSQVRIIENVEVKEIYGDHMVTGLRYKDKRTGEMRDLDVNGVFVQIGSVPNSAFVRGLVETNESGEIVINHQTAQTSREGIFAAGDVTDDPFKQNNIAVGDGVRAALSAYHHVLNTRKFSPCAEKEE